MPQFYVLYSETIEMVFGGMAKNIPYRQIQQNNSIIFVQLYFEMGVDFLADINYNILSGRQKVEVMK